MHCYYINLASAVERRETLEQNLRETAPHWQIHRIEALNGDDAKAVPQFNSASSAPATGCYLSHMRAIEASLQVEGPAIILEDDTQLGKNSARTIENIVASLPPLSWDIILTSVTYMSIDHILAAYNKMRQARETGTLAVSDARSVAFACATTYVVNSHSKKKLLALLNETPVNDGYDMRLRDIFRQGKLQGFIPHPFITSVSQHSVESQLNQNGWSDRCTDLVLNSFRKLLYAEHNLEEIRQDLAATAGYFYDDELDVFGKIFATVMHPKFKGK